jgi:hypothetical protein
MSGENKAYNETTDLYLELLWAAQKVHDQKLVELIKQRLISCAPPETISFKAPAEIIPFPCSFIPSIPYKEEVQLWPRKPLCHALSILGIYFSFLLLYFFSSL